MLTANKHVLKYFSDLSSIYLLTFDHLNLKPLIFYGNTASLKV